MKKWHKEKYPDENQFKTDFLRCVYDDNLFVD